MNRRGLEISMANPVNETISYQTHYVAESGGEGGPGEGGTGEGGEERRRQAKASRGEPGPGRREPCLPEPSPRRCTSISHAPLQRDLYFYFQGELNITRVTFTTK